MNGGRHAITLKLGIRMVQRVCTQQQRSARISYSDRTKIAEYGCQTQCKYTLEAAAAAHLKVFQEAVGRLWAVLHSQLQQLCAEAPGSFITWVPHRVHDKAAYQRVMHAFEAAPAAVQHGWQGDTGVPVRRPELPVNMTCRKQVEEKAWRYAFLCCTA